MGKNVDELTNDEIVEGVASFGIKGLWRDGLDLLAARLGLTPTRETLTALDKRLSRIYFDTNEFMKYEGGPYIAFIIERRAKAYTDFKNPKPIAVALVSAYDSATGAEGILLIRRTDAKFKDMLALPGGYMELGETWQAAVVRELGEETKIEATAAQVLLHHAATSPLNGNLQIFGCIKGVRVDIRTLQPTDEAGGYEVATSGAFDTKFQTHQEAVRLFFERGSFCL